MTDVALVSTTWVDRPHWEASLPRLGVDRHGSWLGGPAGITFRRPGAQYDTSCALAVLVPHDRPWLAKLYAEGAGFEKDVRVYVDMTTPPVWSADGATVTMVDLDLDVVVREDGSVAVDDEDEFAVHQRRFAYPPEIVQLARGAVARRCSPRSRAGPRRSMAPATPGCPASAEQRRAPAAEAAGAAGGLRQDRDDGHPVGRAGQRDVEHADAAG